MRIDPKEKLAGYPIIDIRKLMRRIARFEVSALFIADVLKISKAKAEKLTSELEELNFR